MVLKAEHILEEFNIKSKNLEQKKKVGFTDAIEEEIYNLLLNEPLNMDQISQMDQSPHMTIIVLTNLFRRVELRAMNMCIIPQTIMFISPRRISLLIHMLTLTPLM